MKFLSSLMIPFLFAMSVFNCAPAFAGGGGFKNEPFTKTFYFKFGGTTAASGSSYDAAKPLATLATLWAIQPGMVISRVYVIVDTAITGTTVINIGDEDGATSYCPTASITLATPGIYCWDAKNTGAYLRISTAGATDAGDIYVVPSAKYYTAVKNLAIAFTTANTAGKMRVVVEGYYAGTP